jgi:hypothetical protein
VGQVSERPDLLLREAGQGADLQFSQRPQVSERPDLLLRITAGEAGQGAD